MVEVVILSLLSDDSVRPARVWVIHLGSNTNIENLLCALTAYSIIVIGSGREIGAHKASICHRKCS